MRAESKKEKQASNDPDADGGAARQLWFVQLFELPPRNRSRTFNRIDGLWLCVISLVAIATSLPFFYAAHGQMPEAGDLTIHWPRMLAFDETLRSGVWVPRWLGGMNQGYGAATTLFYAPLLYYALSAAHVVTGDWPKALEAVIVLAAIGSGFAQYAYARALCSRLASAVASLLYVLLPYHLIDLYHRGALAELLAFVWMPLVMLAYAKLNERVSATAIVGGALTFALLILAHPPTAYLFAISFSVFITYLAIRAKRWRSIVNGLVVVALGSTAAAFYALPAIIEKPLVNQSVTDLFRRRMGFITELLSGNRFEQLIGVIAVSMTLLLIVFSWSSRSQSLETEGTAAHAHHFAAWRLAGGISLVMLLPLASPLIGALPGMDAVAFVWRWLAITTLAVAILSGAATDCLFRKFQCSWSATPASFQGHEKRRVAWVGGVSLLVLASIIFGAVAAGRASNLRIAFVAPPENFEQDFTPAGAPSVYELPRGKTCEFVVGSPGDEARLIEWQPERRLIETNSATGGIVQMYTFMFPGWSATSDGLFVAISPHPRLKTMLIEVPAGHHRVVIAFEDTNVRAIARCVSLASLAAITILLLAGRLRHQVGRRKRPARD